MSCDGKSRFSTGEIRNAMREHIHLIGSIDDYLFERSVLSFEFGYFELVQKSFGSIACTVNQYLALNTSIRKNNLVSLVELLNILARTFHFKYTIFKAFDQL